MGQSSTCAELISVLRSGRKPGRTMCQGCVLPTKDAQRVPPEDHLLFLGLQAQGPNVCDSRARSARPEGEVAAQQDMLGADALVAAPHGRQAGAGGIEVMSLELLARQHVHL